MTFTVIDSGDGSWTRVVLDEGGAVEPNVWLNTGPAASKNGEAKLC